MIKNIFNFYLKEGIGFVFSNKPNVYLKDSNSNKSVQNSFGKSPKKIAVKTLTPRKVEAKTPKYENIKPVNNLKSLQAEKNFRSSKNVNTAKEICDGINSIEELKKAINDFDGCDLKILAKNTIVGDGVIKHSPVMVIGNTPSRDDDKAGNAFSGESGLLLDKMLGSIGLSRKNNAYLCNFLNWWPPGNRPSTQEEINVCKPFIKKHIEIINPKLIILLGGDVVKNLLGATDGILKTRGKVFEYNINSDKPAIKAVPMFSPEFLMGNQSMKNIAWKDLQAIQELLKELEK